MKALLKKDSALLTYLKVLAARNTQRLIDLGLYDPVTEGPDLQKVEAELQKLPLTTVYSSMPENDLESFIRFQALHTAVAFQALGNSDIAARWYSLGQYSGRREVKPHPEQIQDPMVFAISGSPLYEAPAVCALLSGNASGARFLFQRILEEILLSDAEILYLQKSKEYCALATCIGYKIFTLMCLGDQWPEVARLSSIALGAIAKGKKTDFSTCFSLPKRLIEIGSDLSGYFLNPCADTREMAVNSLLLEKFSVHDSQGRCDLLGYLFTLIHLYPELSPYSGELWQKPLWRPSMSQRSTPPTKAEIQTALYDIFRQALNKKKLFLEVNSCELHLKVGGYPSTDHRIQLCIEVLRENDEPDPYRSTRPPDPKDGVITVRYLTSEFELWPVFR